MVSRVSAIQADSKVDVPAYIVRYLAGVMCYKPTMQVIGSGTMGGLFSYEDVWSAYDHLRKYYPQYISEKISIGKTVQERSIDGFYIGTNTGEEKV